MVKNPTEANRLNKIQAEQLAEARSYLAEHIKEDMTVYTILRHTSKSGVMRHISVMIIVDGEPVLLDHHVARVLFLKRPPGKPGVKVSASGMDAGFFLVYSLAHVVLKDGHTVKHRWI